ncbi:hypothetical protein P9112_013551 [Eukaryota sp. TZLM1-RC]
MDWPHDCWHNQQPSYDIQIHLTSSYCVVISAAPSLARYFHKDSLMGLILFCNVGIGVLARIINTWFLNSISYTSRILFNTFLMTTGLIGMAFIERFNFWFMLGCVIAMGSASAMGESIILCFLKQYPGDYKLVSAWGTGTGLSGVTGAGYSLVAQLFEVSDDVAFMYLLPTVLVYIIGFFFMIAPPVPVIKQGFIFCKETFRLGDSDPRRLAKNQPQLVAKLEQSMVLNQSPTDNTPLLEDSEDPSNDVKDAGFARFWRVLTTIKYETFNLFMVYILEYVIITTLARNALDESEVIKPKDLSEFVLKHFYKIVQVAYQITVLISRSSLPVVHIPYIGTITLFQFINFCLFLTQDYLRYIPPLGLLGIVLWTGLLGGCSYINTFHILLSTNKLNQKDREYGINMTALAVAIGIAASSLIDLLLDYIWDHPLW